MRRPDPESSNQTARRKEIYEALHPETKHGENQHTRSRQIGDSNSRFTSETARATGRSERAARLAKAKDAHDSLIAAAHRAQADALDIEAQAKRRLADEYDAAQSRGEVGQRTGRPKDVPGENDFTAPTASDIGLTRKQVHEARTGRGWGEQSGWSRGKVREGGRSRYCQC